MKRFHYLLLLPVIMLIGNSGSVLLAQESSDEEEVFELSPFEVSTTSDAGYYASQTLSGGRINSQIENLGTSIQVVTEELLNDIGATKAEEVLLYTANTDVGGPSGNISTPNADTFGTPDDSSIRTNPAGNNRIRAIGSADLTRNYFRTDIPFDRYNSGRLDILRGANSFLFGLGSPSGIINYNLDRAQFNDSGQLGIWFTNEDLESNMSKRFDINLNRVILEDKLAIRVAAVMDRQEYVQELAYRDTDRYYGTFTFKPFDSQNIFLRVNGESGELTSTPPSPLGPLEALSSWLNNETDINFDNSVNRFIGDPFNNIVNENIPFQGQDADGNDLNFTRGGTFVSARKWALVFDGTEDANGLPTRAMQAGVDGNMWRSGDPLFDPDGNFTSGLRGVYFMGYPNLHEIGGDYAGFKPQGLTDYSVFNFQKQLLSGGFDRLEQDFDTYNVTLEATSKSQNFGIEISYNSESIDTQNSIPIGNPILYMDVNKTLVTGPNDLFGSVNPNFGRIFIAGSNAAINTSRIDRETLRATAFAKVDFRDQFDGKGVLSWLGNHTATMLLDSDERDEYGTQHRLYSFGNDAGWHLAQSNATQFQRQTNFNIYVSPAYPAAFTDPNFKMTDFTGIAARSDINLNIPSNFSVPVSYYDLGEPNFKPNPIGAPFGFGSSQVANFSPSYGNADGSIAKSKVKSYAFNTQSMFLNDLLVVNLGWRNDTWKEKRASAPNSTDPADELQRDFSPEVFNLDNVDFNEVEDDNFSYNAVLKMPSSWMPDGYGFSIHYGESSNFIPAASAFDIDGTPVPSGSGENIDYGFTLRAMDDKIITRVNWYETNVSNEPYSAVAFGFAWTTTAHMTRQFGRMEEELWRVDKDGDGKYDADYLLAEGETDNDNNGILDSLDATGNNHISLPELRQVFEVYGTQMTPWLRETNAYNFNETTGVASQGNGAYFTLSDTADVQAKGIEIEAIFNPTKQLRFGLSIVRQKASRTNLAPRFGKMFNTLVDVHNAVPAFKGTNGGNNKLGSVLREPVTAAGTMWNQLILGTFAGQAYYLNTSLSGADNPEVRKYRISAYGNYSFTDGRFKGANIGGAYRYVDNAAIGYGLTTLEDLIIPDVNSVYYDDDTHTFDIWAGYTWQIRKGLRWRIQFNIRNLFADSGTLPVQRHPDGSVARVRYAPPRTFLLQNTISF